jgi:hypothetical protein
MSEHDDARTAIAAAIRVARGTPGKVIVVPPRIAKLPGANEAFQDLAAETGRRLAVPGRDPALQAAIARAAAIESEKPAIPRGDDEAFLRNLRDIAAGKVRVE